MRRLISVLFCSLLAACFTAGRRGGDTPLAIYDFGTAPASLLATPRKQPLAVEVRAPLWFDSQGIAYRLAYVDAARLREYTQARWAGPPAQMIQTRLMQKLDYAWAGQGQAACVLHIEITEFSQVFASPEGSKGVLQGRAILLDRARRQVAEFDLKIAKPATSQDARGGVAALSAAVEQLATDLLRWEKGKCLEGKR